MLPIQNSYIFTKQVSGTDKECQGTNNPHIPYTYKVSHLSQRILLRIYFTCMYI